jgi:two-component system cell cycle response regulator DivK
MDVSEWKVLVVEDTDDDLAMVSKILGFHGIQVYVARNGEQCLDMLYDVHPDLVIMDLAMPGMDGWQTLAAIRSDAHFAGLPIVAATAYYNTDMGDEAHNAGFDAYFEKPLNPRSLVQNLSELIKQ